MEPDTASGPPVHVTRVVAFFETLTPHSIALLPQVYEANARFVDPFNDVQGLKAIEGIFRHMFVALDDPRFVVTGQVVQGPQCFLTWEFHFCFKRFRKNTPQTIHGVTHVVFSDAGLVRLHRDYWDAAQELYEKLPLVGSLMRWLKQRANT
ncbi:MAG: nuclear transport factor 2 family protein [Pseudomonadota bacterium]